MTAKPPPSKKIPSFLIGAVLGGLLSSFALWAFEISTTEATIATIAAFAVSVGLLTAFACPKATERILTYFMTLMNP